MFLKASKKIVNRGIKDKSKHNTTKNISKYKG